MLEVRMMVTFEEWVESGRRYKDDFGDLVILFQSWALFHQVCSAIYHLSIYHLSIYFYLSIYYLSILSLPIIYLSINQISII
jgi:hypothetical protein